VLDDDTAKALDESVDKFKLEFQTGEGKPLASVGTEHFDEIAPEHIAQEQIVKQKR
jgi:F-type H+-transporting ATPase subunit alpha